MDSLVQSQAITGDEFVLKNFMGNPMWWTGENSTIQAYFLVECNRDVTDLSVKYTKAAANPLKITDANAVEETEEGVEEEAEEV